MIDSRIADQLSPYLAAGERVVWTGYPAQGLRFGPRDMFLVPFSALWLGFAVFWEMQASRASDAFFDLWGAMFIVIGAFLFIGRFFIDAYVRSRTLYAVTTDRALLLRRVAGEKLITARLGSAVVERKANGSGNLRFGPGAGGWTNQFFGGGRGRAGFEFWIPSLTDQVDFTGVLDVMEVYRLTTKASPP